MSLNRAFEIAEKIYCLRVAPTKQFGYNSFLFDDEHPIQIHTGRAKFFSETLELAKRILDVEKISYITFSHFEADECGAINQWLTAAPKAVALVGAVGKPSIDDISIRPPNCIVHGEFIDLGRYKLQIHETPHFPHGWDACMFYEPQNKILFSSDIGAQPGVGRRITTTDISARIMRFQEKYGFLSEGADFYRSMNLIEKLEIKILATQHGSILMGSNVAALFERLRIGTVQTVNNRKKLNCEDFGA